MTAVSQGKHGIEAGVKAGFSMRPETLDYIKPRANRPYKVYDRRNAEFAKDRMGRLKMEPRYRCRTAFEYQARRQVGKVEIDQSVIGAVPTANQ